MWTSFFTWLTGQVNNFIATQVGTVSTLLEPAVITLASVYVMMWGYLQLTGKIEEPVLEGGRRLLILGVILVLTFKISQNIAPLLDVFVQSPQALAAGMLGATPMATVDTLWTQGSEVGDSLLSQGSLFSESGLSLIACGLICYLAIGLTTLYVAFLMALALVALAILLALAPLFIAMLLFDSTKRFFEAWIAQLANYALVIILVASVANLMLHAVSQPLQLLESGGVAPDQGDAASIRAQGSRRTVRGFRRPFGMVGGGIVIIHDQRVKTGVQVQPDQAGGIGLLAHQRYGRPHPEIFFI